MDHEDTPPAVRLFLAAAIVFGVIGISLTFIYSWMLLFPLLLLVVVAVAVRSFLRSR